MKYIKRIITWELHQSWGVVMLAVGVIAGCVLGVVLRINYFASPVWIVLVGTVFILMYLKPKFLIVGLCLVAGMVLAFFRVAGELSGEEYIRQFWGVKVEVSGVVANDPMTDESATKLKLSELKFGDGCGSGAAENPNADNGQGGCIVAAGNIYVSLGKHEELKRGDTLVLSGKMSEGFGTYAGYMYRPEVLKILKPEPGNLVVMVRDFFAEQIASVVPEPEVKLGLSYLLGMKTGLPDDIEDNLRAVGLTHIVVASGAHLSILVEIARKIFGKISRFAGLMFSILFILFFMMMVGWTPSILRAGVMTMMALSAWYVGRKAKPLRMIVMVAAFTLMLNPMYLMDLGWLLSFASYAGIMLVGPAITKFFYGEKKPKFVASTVITTLAATVMTLPIILYYYGQASIINVVANLLILPTLSYAMGLVFLSGVSAWILGGVPVVVGVVGLVTEKLLDYHIWVVSVFGEMEQFVITMDAYEPKVFLLYLVVLVPVAVWGVKRVWGCGIMKT